MERVAAVRRVSLGVPDAELAELYKRVREVGGDDELVGYWVERYDWRGHEERLNAFEHFATEVDGQFVHFMHSRSAQAEAPAVLLTHGWPSGVLDVVEAAEGVRSTHHLVMPSIAWTALPEAAGWDVLMRRLGYDDYVVRDDRGEVPAASTGPAPERRGLTAEELAEVRWFNENLTASSEEQQVRALVLSAAMLAGHAQRADWDAILTGVMLPGSRRDYRPSSRAPLSQQTARSQSSPSSNDSNADSWTAYS